MADEVRRSGRATKGQHTKNGEELDANTKKKGKGGRGRPAKQASAELEPEDGEGPAIIRCICGYDEEDDDDHGAMISCDNCLAWQHNVCMGMPTDDDDLPDKYYCERCRPGDHKELLDGMSRGEKPWEERQARYEREEQEKKHRKRKGGKRGKKGKAGDKEVDANGSEPPAGQSPAVETKVETGQKRKVADLVVEVPSSAEKSLPSAKTRKVSTPKESKPTARRQSTVVATPTRRDSKALPLQAELVENISDLHNPGRQRAAKALDRLFVDATEAATKQGTFKLPSGQSSAEFGLRLGLSVEYALYLNLWGHSEEPSPQYGAQLRTVLHNVKANISLRDRLLNGSLSANELSQMSSFDMASKEKKEEDEKIMKEAEKQHIMVQEEGPRIRRTHKGDELIGEETHHLTTSEPIYANVPRRRESEIEGNMRRSPDHDGPGSPNAVELPQDIADSPEARSRPKQERKSSSNFNINNVWSNVESPTVKQFAHQPTPNSAGVQVDPEVDSLLKDEEDEEPYSPMDYEMEPGTIWRGSVLMATVAEFRASARHVAGANLSDVYPWANLVPQLLSIEGRIAVDKASTYLCGLQWSKTTDVTVISLTPAESAHDRAQFDKLFAYFTERNRYGVIGRSPVTNVRDIYVVPLEAGTAAKPDFIELLQDCEIPSDRHTRSLLVTYVIKVRTEGAPVSAQATPRHPDFAGSPVAPHQPTQGHYRTPSLPQQHMSPVVPQGGFPPQTQQGSGATPLQNQNQYPHQQPYSPPQATVSIPNTGPVSTSPSASAPPISPSKLTGHAAAASALGPLVSAPVVRELLAQAPNTGVVEFGVIREVLEQVPGTSDNLGKLMEVLSARMTAASVGK